MIDVAAGVEQYGGAVSVPVGGEAVAVCTSDSDSCSSTPARVSSASSARNISEADSLVASVKEKTVLKWIFYNKKKYFFLKMYFLILQIKGVRFSYRKGILPTASMYADWVTVVREKLQKYFASINMHHCIKIN